MEREEIRRLGRSAFQQHLQPQPLARLEESCVAMGFDMEYDSKTGELLSVQLSCQGEETFRVLPPAADFGFPQLEPLVEELLARCDLTNARKVFLISYWTPAELSHLADWWIDAKVKRVHSSEVYNATYKGECRQLIVYDLYHFFFPKGLGKVAPAFGERKLEWNRAAISRADLTKPEFREYALNDAHITERIFLRLRGIILEKFNVDILIYKTPAGAVMAHYKAHYLPEPAKQRRMWLRRLAMRCNKGGIGEAYYRGDLDAPPGDPFAQLDATSLYPNAAVALGGLPLNEESWHVTHKEPPLGTQGVCKVRFAFPPTATRPCLPVVFDGCMFFPLNGVSYCTVAEVRAAQVMGAKVDWLTVAYYEPTKCDNSFARMLQDLMLAKDAAETAGNEAERIVCKNLANCSVGKLSQRHKGMEIEELKELAERHHLPLELVANPSFRDNEKSRVTPGATWMPEWHALILGMARAIMAPVIETTQSLTTSTDSVLCLKSQADAFLTSYRGPCPFKFEAEGPRLRVVRQRVYLLQDAAGRTIKLAHHALHKRARDAARIIQGVRLGARAKYEAKKRATLLAALQGIRPYGEEFTTIMVYDSAWPGKRQLLPNGTTRPWPTVAAYLTYRRSEPT